jgi:predicted CopG family antitoxin
MAVKGHCIATLYHLTNDALIDETEERVADERKAIARIVAALAEIESRKAYVDLGYSSLRSFCEGRLKYSGPAACRRIRAARLASRYPVILDRLVDGSLNLTAVNILSPHLTDENYQQLLESAAGKSKVQIEELVAGLRQGEPPNTTTLTITLSAEAYEELKRLSDLMRHTIADGNFSKVLEKAISHKLREVEYRAFGKTNRPRKTAADADPSASGPPTPATKRAVAARDGHRCTFVGADDHRCEETRFLQYHHLIEESRGGKSTPDNITLRCARHNRRSTEVEFLGLGTKPKRKVAKMSGPTRAGASPAAKARGGRRK